MRASSDPFARIGWVGGGLGIAEAMWVAVDAGGTPAPTIALRILLATCTAGIITVGLLVALTGTAAHLLGPRIGRHRIVSVLMGIFARRSVRGLALGLALACAVVDRAAYVHLYPTAHALLALATVLGWCYAWLGLPSAKTPTNRA